jgi:EmrB/QacA subfamily drug resistance transporter
MASPTTRNAGLLLALACIAQFMVVLDVAIVNVALPTIQTALGVAQTDLQWIIVGYALPFGGFLLLGGRLTDLLGRRRVLVTGLALFALASLVSGVADSTGVLIAARVVQGLGAALVPPAALSIIAVTFEEGAARNRAIGLFGAVTGIAGSVGVVASGLLTDSIGWRSIFLINLPIGVVLILMAIIGLRGDVVVRRTGARFDAAGAVVGTLALLALIFGVNRGAGIGWFSPWALGSLAVGAALLVTFVAIERRSRDPLLPAAALRSRTLIGANLAAFFTFGAFFAFIFLGSLLMQQVLHFTPTQTGLAWLATTATSFIAAAVTGSKLVTVLGVRALLILGQALLAVAVLLLTGVVADATYAANILPALLLAGIAGGIAAPAAQIGALSSIAPELTGTASGLVETLRELGGAIGVAVAASILIASSSGLDGFHAGFWGIVATAATGVVVTIIVFPRRPAASPSLEATDSLIDTNK